MTQNLDRFLEATLAGSVERKMDSMTAIIYTMAKEHFGMEEKKGRNTAPGKRTKRREREIMQLRREIKALNMQYKQASPKVTTGLRGQLRRLRRAARSLRLRKEKEVKHAQFTKDPYRFTKTLLGEARSRRLTSP